MNSRGYPGPAPAPGRHTSFGGKIESPFVAYLEAQPEPQRSTLLFPIDTPLPLAAARSTPAVVATSPRTLLPDAEACVS